ncbi:Lnb N-terminal periplasmic domain-containing protein [Horticoccus sp. 23ND18S-11]|uniref:Lnb N-terminal periplasmic domain-containing protein n=1 Tax=Horticoccus sp. 23ND18S-11 TaxID=3391832 RepID=UPI0039C985BA
MTGSETTPDAIKPHPRRTRTWLGLTLLVAAAIVGGGWLGRTPRTDRDWDPEGAELAWGEVAGDVVTVHNVRNFTWRSPTDVTPRWETRTYRLSQLRHLDFIMTYWGSPHVCHTMVTFDFGPDGRLCASIEARREVGEEYSALRGMFRGYELIYVLGDERDLVRLRTRIRPHNDVHLFRLKATPEVTRTMFLDYIDTANGLRSRPAWYHSLLTNCSTSIRHHVRRAHIADPWDWRVLANGHADERLYEFGYVERDLPLPELKRRSHINEAALAADQAPDFSDRIRAGRPGF